MEILFVSHKYPPSTGGMEKQSFELIRNMKHYAGVHQLVYTGGGRLKFFIQLKRRIEEILRVNPQISIIHFNDGLLAALSLLLSLPKGPKRCVTLHGLDVVFPGLLYQKWILPKFNHFDLLIAVSHATAQACIKRGILKEKIMVVPNGVDSEIRPSASREEIDQLLLRKFSIDSAGKRILTAMGRPVRRKGFSWFVSKVLPKLHPDCILLLIGPVQSRKNLAAKVMRTLPGPLKRRTELFLGYPSDERTLEKLVQTAQFRKRVFRLGRLPFEEVTRILSASDAFVMPNIEVEGDMEGFGLVCLEACMSGAAVFAAASGGITDAIVSGKNGQLVPAGHIASWVELLNGYTQKLPAEKTDPQEAIDFTRLQYGWPKMARQYFEAFRQLAGN